MNKLAIFVEGNTEVVFIEKLIEEIAGQNRVLVEHREIRGGNRTRRTMGVIKAAKPTTGEDYFILLVDCGGDELVKTRILEEHENLTKAGYSKIIGIRDVRPTFTHADIPKLEAALPKYIKTSLIPVEFVLAILEIESWFLAESTHFEKVDPAITLEAIQLVLGFHPEKDDMEQRLTPADDLDHCYAIAGKAYDKQQARDTVNALDYARIYLELANKIGYLKRLIESIEEFLR
jgi:hypothetical protein